jgi:hypothetical protein
MAAELGLRVHCRSAPVQLVQRHGYSPGYTIDPLHVVQHATSMSAAGAVAMPSQ